MTPHAFGTTGRVYLFVFGQVEDYDPFIDTLDYVFHTPGITAVEVTQVTSAKISKTCFSSVARRRPLARSVDRATAGAAALAMNSTAV